MSPNGPLAKFEAQRTPEAHIILYKKFLKVTDYLLPKGDHIRPTLWHWDIRPPNIFVHGDQIANLIDWQYVWVGPLFLQAQNAQLVNYDGEIVLRLPEYYDTPDDEDEKSRIRTQVEKSIILWTYGSETRKENSIVHDILHVCQGRTRRDTVQFSANTWDRDIIPFRQCLILIVRYVWPFVHSQN